MSTHVTVAVAKPNHLAVKVYAEEKIGPQWVAASTSGEAKYGTDVRVGGAEVFLVHGTRRLVIEEMPA